MIEWVLMSIGILFVFITLIRNLLKEKLNIKVCAICAAVSLTWIALLVLRFLGYNVSDLIIGILMGQSVTGIMYLFENTAKNKGKKNLLWFKVFIILLGTLFVYYVVSLRFDIAFFIVLGLVILFAVFLISLIKGKKSQAIVDKNYGKFKNEIKKLEDKFEHCCD